MIAPSAYKLQAVMSAAMATLEALRTEHGQVIEDDTDILTALAEEGIDVETILRRLISAALDAKASAAAAGLRIADLALRKDRFARREETYRATILAVMQAVDLRKYATPEAGLSISDGRPKVIITDADELPRELVKTTLTTAPDRLAIMAALKLGEVPGAVLSNGGAILTLKAT